MTSLLIDIARRRQKPGSGSLPGPINPKTTQMFRDILSVPYALIGGQATKSYMPERSTLDWDVLIDASDLDQARSDIVAAGAVGIRPLTIVGFGCRLQDSTMLDVIADDGEWVAKALTEAGTRCAEHDDPVLALEWLVLLKLKAGRVQDLADVSRMMGCASDQDVEATQAVASQWLPDAGEDLASLIQLGRMEAMKDG